MEINIDKLSLKDWAPEDKPREKLMLKGVQALTDAELLAILLGSGSTGQSVVELARKMLNHTGNDLQRFGMLKITEMTQFKGIGNAKAVTIAAAMELGRRRKAGDRKELTNIKSSRDAYGLLAPMLEDLEHEEFWVLYLNRANKVIHMEMISSGGTSGTVVDIKILFRNALQRLTHGMIIAHNHPSGNLQASRMDKEITQKIYSSAKLMDMSLVDHLIISTHGYLSFADEGMLSG